MMRCWFSIIVLITGIASLLSCGDDDTLDIPSADDRKKAATDSLRALLTAPQFGYRVDYQPDPDFGAFLMLLKFEQDGTVNIKTGIPNNQGEFADQTITYRIDNGIGTELIFETYSAFSFLAEVAGGEYEFLYLGQSFGNLVFRSKTDVGAVTTMTLEPAGEFDENLLSNEITNNLRTTLIQDPSLFGSSVYQQLYLNNRDISIFMTLDLDVRTIAILNAAVGETMTQILANNNTVNISRYINYSVQGSSIVLTEPFNFSLNGNDILLSEFSLDDFQSSQITVCTDQNIPAGNYVGQVGSENITFNTSIFSSRTNFTPLAESPYSVSSVGFFDDQDESLEEDIAQVLPNFAAIQLYYNYTQINPALTAIGFVLFDEATSDTDFFLREFSTPTFDGNIMKVSFTGQNLITRDFTTAEEQGLIDFTDLLFEGGEVYILEFSTDDTAFELYNPCNQHKLILFR